MTKLTAVLSFRCSHTTSRSGQGAAPRQCPGEEGV